MMQNVDYDSIAEIYDLYVTADYDIPFFLSEARTVKGSILELMAGTGRMSLPLIEAGATLTCVDSSGSMLDVLSQKLASRGLHADIHCKDEFEQMARSAGFRVAQLYGSYDRAPFDPVRSPVMIWSLEKK